MSVTRTVNTLWVARSAFAQMRQLATDHAPLETGGMVLGYEADSGESVVTTMIGPGPNARHRRYRFRPDYNYQQAQLEDHFSRTEGRVTYLGDWHTHPSGASALSWRDKQVLARIASTPSSRTEHPIMLVLAGDEEDWKLCAVRLVSLGGRIFPRVELAHLSPKYFSKI